MECHLQRNIIDQGRREKTYSPAFAWKEGYEREKPKEKLLRKHKRDATRGKRRQRSATQEKKIIR